MLQSLRYVVRSLLGAPAFTAIAVVTLALGIGVNSSMYSVMNALMFSTVPFPRPDSIVSLFGRSPEAQVNGFSAPELNELRAHPAQAFVAIAPLQQTREAVILSDQVSEEKQGVRAHADLFKVLETPPLLGRTFSTEECVDGRDAVVLITEALWRKQFGAKPEVLGQTMRISARVFTIIGVLPKVYSSAILFGECEYFRPLVYTPDQEASRNRREFGCLARLAPGFTPTQAMANLTALTDRWAKDTPILYPKYNITVRQAGQAGRSGNFSIIGLQMGVAAAILAIACANLANLQMARAVTRLRDLAIRSALGASRWMLIKQQLLESLVIAAAGGALGLLIARWCNELVGRNIKTGINSTMELSIDARVLGFTAAISILSGLCFGLVPAWLASRTDVNMALKQQTRSASGSKTQGWIRSLLVIGQVALSLAMLSVAGMMIHGLGHILNFRPAWDSESILTSNVQVEEAAYGDPAKARALYEALGVRLARIPGVEASTIASMLPDQRGWREDAFIEGQDFSLPTRSKANMFLVTSGYFKTLGIRLLEGKTFPENVSPASVEQVVISQSLAKHFWPTGGALGKRLGTKNPSGKVSWREIIGVVADAEPTIVFGDPYPQMQCYSHFIYQPWAWFQIALRGDNPGRFENDLRRAVSEVAPTATLRTVMTIAEMRDKTLHNLVVINAVLLGFALLGLTLASVGLYGVVAHNVNQRMTEFGIRLALGARQTDLLRIVLRQGLRLTLIGLGLGAIGSYELCQLLQHNLGPIITQSYVILGGTSVAIFAVSLLATWLPARRATEADPIVALRAE
jgi:putative ABC transport system permease protein